MIEKIVRYGYLKDGKFVDCGPEPEKLIERQGIKAIYETYPVKQETWKLPFGATWGEFKEFIEHKGITDDWKIDWIDVSDFLSGGQVKKYEDRKAFEVSD